MIFAESVEPLGPFFEEHVCKHRNVRELRVSISRRSKLRLCGTAQLEREPRLRQPSLLRQWVDETTDAAPCTPNEQVRFMVSTHTTKGKRLRFLYVAGCALESGIEPVAYTMRHEQILHKLQMEDLDAQMQRLVAVQTTLLERLDRSEAKREEMFEMMVATERVCDQLQERELEQKRRKAAAERQRQLEERAAAWMKELAVLFGGVLPPRVRVAFTAWVKADEADGPMKLVALLEAVKAACESSASRT